MKTKNQKLTTKQLLRGLSVWALVLTVSLYQYGLPSLQTSSEDGSYGSYELVRKVRLEDSDTSSTSPRRLTLKQAAYYKSLLINAIKDIAPKYKLNPRELSILALKESSFNIEARADDSKGGTKYALKFEEARSCPATLKLYTTAHGPYQIMGYHSAADSVPIEEFYRPREATEYAAKFWKTRRDKCSLNHKKEKDILFCTALAYNGARAYAAEYVTMFYTAKI